MSNSTEFNIEYILSIVIALLATYGLSKTGKLPPIVTYGILPLSVAYATLQILNAFMPGLNRAGDKVSAYVENKTLGKINNMGYVQVFPPLLAVIILIFVLLFTNNLV